ncbi:MAG: hypothetical protein EBS71_00965 [Actinobacteria bacterium]|nr:hypothetical protein [Actinomycetota bacterium]
MATFQLTKRPEVLVGLAAMLPSLVGNRSGIGLSWDSTDYIAVGLSMAAGRGALDVTGVPMVIRPPGLSAFVTVGDWLTLSPDWTLRLVNAVAMFVIVWCTHRLLVRAQVRAVSLWLGVALVALSPTLLDIFTMAWSEPPFLALLMIALVIATRERTWPWELVLAGLFTALFFVRYVGPFYAAPLALVAALVQVRKSGVLLAFFRSGTALAVSMVAPWLWLMRNKDISGYLTGYREPGGGTLLDPLRTMTGTLGSWLIARPPLSGNGGIYLNWADFSGYMKFAGVVLWVVLIGLSIWFFFSQRDASPRVVIVAACLWVFVFYSSFSVYRFVYNEMGPLDSRMMSGVYVPLIIVLVVTLDHLASSVRVARVAVAIALLVGAWHANTMVRDSIRYGESGRHWGTEFHREVPIHSFARDLPESAALFSNEPQSLFAATFHWPIRNQYQYSQPTLVDCDRRYFVWFNQSFLPDGKPVGGTVVYEDSWGQVIDLDRCDTDIGRFWP